MLAIPVVKCEQPSLQTNSLKAFLNSHRNSTSNTNHASSINEDISLFIDIRNAAVSVPLESLTDSTFEQNKILRYSYILKSLCSRINDYESELGFTFGWKDAFNANKKVSCNSLYLEIAACLWNLGSIGNNL